MTEGEARTISTLPQTSIAPAETRPQAVTGFAAKATDLDALRGAVVDAAGVSAGLWFSYLFVVMYLLVAVFGVTHRDLLYESPVRLPFLNIDLPLVGFFTLAPLLFLIVHAYVLLHLVLLAGKVGAFHVELEKQIDDDDTRARLRNQLPSNVFVQFLAGPREVRTGILGVMLRLIAQISLVGGPLALLLSFQLQFLPHHHPWVTWWHRCAFTADIALLWMLWPSIAHGRTTWITWGDLRRRKVAAAALASVLVVLTTLLVVTFPDEWLDSTMPSVRFIPTKWPSAQPPRNKPSETVSTADYVRSMGWASLHDLLVGGDIDFIARKPKSLWSNRLVLPGIDVLERTKFDSDQKINAVSETLSLRGRRLEGAVLPGARLRKVNLSGARLQGALLAGADLREANLGCATGSEYGTLVDGDACAHLENAVLEGAQLQVAKLEGAWLDGAILYGALLQGADARRASLRDANLAQSNSQGATFAFAAFAGADLAGAGMQGADLEGANLAGVEFGGPETGSSTWGFQGANLRRTTLRGVHLEGVPLLGADLSNADLRDARLRNVDLRGAKLTSANFQGAEFEGVSVWRADPQSMRTPSARFSSLDLGPLIADRFLELKKLIDESVLDPTRRGEALGRIEVLNHTALDDEADAAVLAEWKKLAK